MASNIDPDIAADFGGAQQPAPASTTRIDPDIAADFNSSSASGVPLTWARGALGAAQFAGALIPNTLATIGNAGIDLASRATGFGPRKPIPMLSGQAERETLAAAGRVVPSTPNGLDVSDQELRETLDPSGRIPIEQLRSRYAAEQKIPLTERMFGPTASNIIGHAVDVGGDVATLAPVVGGIAGAATARSATKAATGAIEEGHPLSTEAQAESQRISSARAAAQDAGLSIPEKEITPLQQFVRSKAREDLGLPGNSPVTPDFLDKAISKKAGPIFDAVETTPAYTNGPKYAAAVKGLDASKIEPVTITETAADGSITARQLRLPQPGDSIDGSDTLALSREYRERADMAYTDASNPSLTSAQRRAAQIEGANYKAAAKAVEAGYSDAEPVTAKKWDEARQYTAKVKAWQSAADSAGNVDPTKIKRMVAGESITSPAMQDAATVAASSANRMPPPSLPVRIAKRLVPGFAAAGGAALMGGHPLGAAIGEIAGERAAQEIR